MRLLSQLSSTLVFYSTAIPSPCRDILDPSAPSSLPSPTSSKKCCESKGFLLMAKNLWRVMEKGFFLLRASTVMNKNIHQIQVCVFESRFRCNEQKSGVNVHGIICIFALHRLSLQSVISAYHQKQATIQNRKQLTSPKGQKRFK